MLHEFEEMIMLPAWIRKNEKELSVMFPALRTKLLFLKSPAFVIAVCEEFIIVSACTIVAITTGSIQPWYICLLAFSLHFMAHVVQFLILRRYIPAIVSTLLCLPYCVKAISVVYEQYSIAGNILLAVASLVICIANLYVMQNAAPRIYAWMKNRM